MNLALALLRFMAIRPVRFRTVRTLVRTLKTQPRQVVLGDDETGYAFLITKMPGVWMILRAHADDINEVESDFNVGFGVSTVPTTMYQVIWGESINKSDHATPVVMIGDGVIKPLGLGKKVNLRKFTMDLRMGTWMPTDQEILDLTEQVARARSIEDEEYR